MADRQRNTGYGVVEQYTSRHHPRGAIGVAAILVATLLLCIAPGELWAVQFHGTVVDAETRQPLVGAAVVVVWRKKPYLTMDGPEYVHKLREAVTDDQGRFSIDGSPGIDWNPFSHVNELPEVVTYAVGYQPLAPGFVVARGYTGERALVDALAGEATIALPRLTDDSRPGQVAELGALGMEDVPFERIPNLLRVVNEQRRRMGVPVYHPRAR